MLTEETVHLHLEQRVAQRLLARFRAQGFIHHDLSRACLAQVADSIPRVILLGRLSLYGSGAERLHEELVPVAARWVELDRSDGAAHASTPATPRHGRLELLERSLARRRSTRSPPSTIARQLLDAAPRDVDELLPQLEARAPRSSPTRPSDKLRERGERERRDLRETLERQRDRVREELGRHGASSSSSRSTSTTRSAASSRRTCAPGSGGSSSSTASSRREPQRIGDFYEVRATRVEPVGLVYLWPETN